MANNQQELQRLLNIIPVGRANAMHAEDIARGMGYPTGGNQKQHHMQQLRKELGTLFQALHC